MKKMMMAIAAALMLMVGCETVPTDYGNYLQHVPRSIVVLPPLNNTAEVKASDAFMSTVTESLAECGYYVFPIAVVDRMLKENGLPTPGEMHAVSPAKLREVFGADAAMYITIRQWTTTYIVIDSTTSVTMHYRLVDLASETTIWEQEQTVAQSSSQQSGGGIVGMLAGAAMHAMLSAALQLERSLARTANATVFNDAHHGLLRGPHHPGHDQSMARAREMLVKLEAMRAAEAAKGKATTQ